MLEYEELKEAVDNGFIQGDKVMIVRRDGKIFDYVLPCEPVRPWEVVALGVHLDSFFNPASAGLFLLSL